MHRSSAEVMKAERLILSLIQEKGVVSRAQLVRAALRCGIKPESLNYVISDFLLRRFIEYTVEKKFRFASR